MAKLSDADRALRDQQRKAAKTLAVQQQWQDNLAQTRDLVPHAAHALQHARANNALDMRELWLVLGVFVTKERMQAIGINESCKSRWFDNIAPRAKEGQGFRGMAGFTARIARKAHAFLRISGNGYVDLTDMGFALAQHLRNEHPELAKGVVPLNSYIAVEVSGLGRLPAPLWLNWKDWTA